MPIYYNEQFHFNYSFIYSTIKAWSKSYIISTSVKPVLRDEQYNNAIYCRVAIMKKMYQYVLN